MAERLIPRRVANRKRLVLSMIFFSSLIYLILTMDRELQLYDEGIVLSDAMRVNAGQVAHRDFYSPYAPGGYYIVALLMNLFAAKFAAIRLYGMIIIAAITTLTAAATLNRVRHGFTALATLSTLFLAGSSSAYLYPLFPCIGLALAGSLMLIGASSSRRKLPLIGAGACAGLATYFRYDVGFMIFVSNGLAFAVIAARDGSRVERLGTLARGVALYGCGTAMVLLTGFLTFLRTGSTPGFLADVVEYGTKYYAAMRGLPFPRIDQIRRSVEQADVYLPLLALACAMTELYFARRSNEASVLTVQWRSRSLIVFAILTLCMFVKGYVRVSPLHLTASIVPALIVLALCADAWWSRSRSMRRGSMLAIFGLALPLAGAGQQQWAQYRYDVTRSMGGWLLAEAGLPAFHLPDLPNCAQPEALWPSRQSADYVAIANYLRAHSDPGKPILVALDRHDRIFINAISLYFMADRLPATHWHQFDPGVQTRADIQSAMVDELRIGRVDWVVRDASFSDVEEPNASAISSGVKVLDRFLATHYRKVASSGRVAIWLRYGVDAPVSASGPTACMPPDGA